MEYTAQHVEMRLGAWKRRQAEERERVRDQQRERKRKRERDEAEKKKKRDEEERESRRKIGASNGIAELKPSRPAGGISASPFSPYGATIASSSSLIPAEVDDSLGEDFLIVVSDGSDGDDVSGGGGVGGGVVGVGVGVGIGGDTGNDLGVEEQQVIDDHASEVDDGDEEEDEEDEAPPPAPGGHGALGPGRYARLWHLLTY